jgi:antitoxin (DNA-binding transcriptional repressor) of toxin-antitoxin stability system
MPAVQLRDFNVTWVISDPVDLVTTGSYHSNIMKSVGVKQLKSRLSEYLRLVRSGETVLVTDRDEVVAELRPARRQPGSADSLDSLLDSLVERGEVTRASLPKRRWTWKAKGLGLAAGSANALLAEIRSDR